MRKFLIGVVILIVPLCTFLMISGMLNKASKHKLTTEKISRLPKFSFMKLSGETFNSSEITSGPVLIMRFHPECEHCQYEISELFKSNIPSSGTKVIMVSSAPVESISGFLDKFNYKNYTSIIPLADTSYSFGEIFGNNIVPANYIYNKELELVKVLNGEIKTETLIKYLTN